MNSSEGVISVYWRRSAAEACLGIDEAAVHVSAVLDTVCFTVKFVNAE